MMGNLLWIAIAYVMGSIPFGLVFARTFCGVDPRTGGSRNVGATNVARLCGTKWGVATLVCDALKGALPVAIALSFSDSTLFHSLTALAALLGHLHSCFLSFKGGKAVATTVGVFIPLAFWQLVLAGIACLLVIWRSGFVSLGTASGSCCRWRWWSWPWCTGATARTSGGWRAARKSLGRRSTTTRRAAVATPLRPTRLTRPIRPPRPLRPTRPLRQTGRPPAGAAAPRTAPKAARNPPPRRRSSFSGLAPRHAPRPGRPRT